MKNSILFWMLIGVFGFIRAASPAEPGVKPTVVLISGEYEYHSSESLPTFKTFLETHYPLRCTYLQRASDPNRQDIPGLEVLEQAQLAILFIRRMTLPEERLAKFKKYLAAGKPLIGLRTSSHAFENWKEFDREVLGGNYAGHHDAKLTSSIIIIPEAAGHPILHGLASRWSSPGSLYRNSPLPNTSTPLLLGSIPNHPPEPVAWTHSYQGARIFYTSLGHPKDFEEAAFQQLLVNAIFWALERPVPPRAGGPQISLAAGFAEASVIKRIDVDEFEKLWRENKYVVLDVRTAKEFDAGHIPGAINIDVNAPDFEQKLVAIDRDKPYLVHCAAGARSSRACDKMRRLNFRQLYDLAPGFKAWEKAGKPVEK